MKFWILWIKKMLWGGTTIIFFFFYFSCSSNSVSGPDTGPDTLEPNLTSIQANIFSSKCALSGCHVNGGLAPMSLQNAEISFSNLVNVASVQKPAVMRVSPNNADGSYLVQKLEGAAGIFGARMPLGRDPLSAQEINVIRQWINNGAPRPQSGGVGGGY